MAEAGAEQGSGGRGRRPGSGGRGAARERRQGSRGNSGGEQESRGRGAEGKGGLRDEEARAWPCGARSVGLAFEFLALFEFWLSFADEESKFRFGENCRVYEEILDNHTLGGRDLAPLCVKSSVGVHFEKTSGRGEEEKKKSGSHKFKKSSYHTLFEVI